MLDALIQQVAFRWRSDDGSETAATWVAAENVDITINTAAPVKFRLRLVAAETNGDTNERNQMYWIQANLNGGVWVTLTESNQGVGFVLIPSDFVTHGIPTTEQLLTNPAPYSAGHFVSQNPSGLEITLTGGNRTEWEYCIGLDPGNFNTNDFFQFRMVGDGDIPLDVYQILAQFTLTKPTVVTFSGTAVASSTAVGQPGVIGDRALVGSALAVANTSGNLRWVGLLKAAVTAIANSSAGINIRATFAASISGIASASASIGKAVFYSGAVVGTAAVTGSFVTAFFIGTATLNATASVSASFNRILGLGAAIISEAFTFASLKLNKGLVSSITATATTSGKLKSLLPSSGHTQTGIFGN